MADFDEYDYLEKQMDRKGAATNGRRSEERPRDRDRDRDRDGHRSRDRDRDSDRHKDRDRDHHKPSRSSRRSRSRSRERKSHHSRELHKPIRRERTPPEVREARDRERELQELDRDIRTVFAYNLSLKASEREIFEMFSRAGKITDVRIIMDRNTRKSKGFAYIEYANREDIINALGLTGQLLMGQPVMVKSSEAEKNLAWEAAQQQSATLAQMNALAAGGAGSGPCKLFVGNLHINISETDLKQIFDPFGVVELVTLQRDGSGRSQGIGYVQYGNMSDATKAMQQIDGLEIANQKISVKIAALSPAETAAAAVAAHVDLDDNEDEYGGLKLTSNARAALMNRLAGTSAPGGSGANTTPLGAPMGANGMSMVPGAVPGGMLPGSGPLPGPPQPAQPPPMPQVTLSGPAQALTMERGLLGPASPIPSPCILLKNMFDPAEETEAEWDQDIAEEAKEECGKYGRVLHVYVDRNSKGFVYLKFDSQEGASAALKALHGRWFGGRQVVAEFQIAALYNSHFKP